MKIINKATFAVVITFVLSLSAMNAYAATTPTTNSTNTFAVLAHSFTYANSGTVIAGDVGYNTTSGTGLAPTVNGSTNAANATYIQAGLDQNTTATALNSQACTFTFPAGTINLATANVGNGIGVYTPGVYCTSGTPGNATIGGTMTLDGNGTYIFRINGIITTATSSQVNAINGASGCNIFWTTVAGPVLSTLGSYSKFAGTLIEPSGLIIKDHLSWVGRALVYNGLVSINEKDTISIPTSCTPPPPATATLHVIKHVINDNGGTATASSFMLHAKGIGSMGTADVIGSPASGVESPGTSYTLPSGNYAVSENTFSGYTQSFSGNCDSSGNITLASGDNKSCTITNDDIAPYIPPYIPPFEPPYNPPYTPPVIVPKDPPSTSTTATLHVIKTVINDNSGTSVASDFTIFVKRSGINITGSPAAGVGTPGKTYTLAKGTYMVKEGFAAGYTMKFSGDCSASGRVVLKAGSDKTCIITNNDKPVPTITTTTIITPPENLYTVSPKLPNTGTPQKTGLPTRLTIPSLRVNAPIQHVGIGKDGAMVSPTGPFNTAWFNLGPTPGINGTAVIAGHFGRWLNGSRSVFDNISKLKKGDKVSIKNDQGKTITFIVRETKTFDPNISTPETNIFLSNDGKAHLNLITCDGAWNKVTKSFPKRLVVFTDRE